MLHEISGKFLNLILVLNYSRAFATTREMVYIMAPHDNRIRVRRNSLEHMEGLIFYMLTVFLLFCCYIT